MKSPALPHHEEPEREIDRWHASAGSYRLVERGGVYRLEVWELYRFTVVEHGLQAVARRVAELARGAESSESGSKVVALRRGKL